MNAKQRKQTEKMRERAMLDAGGVLARIELERKSLEDLRTKAREDEGAARSSIAKLALEQAQFKREQENWRVEKDTRIIQRLNVINTELAEMREKFVDYEDGKILREVLLALDMDISPDDIAAKLRQDHQLLVPQW